MKKRILVFALWLISCFAFAQESTETVKDTVSKKPKLTASIDVVYPYMWRGTRYYGDRVAFQPYIEYDFTKKLSLQVWASTNFSNASDAYNEYDWTIFYKLSPVVTLVLADYYWPATTNNQDWSRSNYFDFSEGSSQSVDFSVEFDFYKRKLPLFFRWNTFIAGNDYNYDEEGNATTRAFSSFAEIGYTYSLKKPEMDIDFMVGAVIINGGYFAKETDEDPGFEFTNFEISVTKEINITKEYSVPLYVSYIHNPYGVEEFDNDGNLTKTIRNFFSCGLTFDIL